MCYHFMFVTVLYLDVVVVSSDYLFYHYRSNGRSKMFYDNFDRSFFHFHFHSITEGGPSAGADLQGALRQKKH